MAEIPIERKADGGRGWLWAIVALVVLALLWWFLARDRDGADAPATTGTTAPAAQVTPPSDGAAPLVLQRAA